MFTPIDPTVLFKQPTRNLTVMEPFNETYTAVLVGFGILSSSTSLIVIDDDGVVHNVDPQYTCKA